MKTNLIYEIDAPIILMLSCSRFRDVHRIRVNLKVRMKVRVRVRVKLVLKVESNYLVILRVRAEIQVRSDHLIFKGETRNQFRKTNSIPIFGDKICRPQVWIKEKVGSDNVRNSTYSIYLGKKMCIQAHKKQFPGSQFWRKSRDRRLLHCPPPPPTNEMVVPLVWSLWRRWSFLRILQFPPPIKLTVMQLPISCYPRCRKRESDVKPIKQTNNRIRQEEIVSKCLTIFQTSTAILRKLFT